MTLGCIIKDFNYIYNLDPKKKLFTQFTRLLSFGAVASKGRMARFLWISMFLMHLASEVRHWFLMMKLYSPHTNHPPTFISQRPAGGIVFVQTQTDTYFPQELVELDDWTLGGQTENTNTAHRWWFDSRLNVLKVDITDLQWKPPGFPAFVFCSV